MLRSVRPLLFELFPLTEQLVVRTAVSTFLYSHAPIDFKTDSMAADAAFSDLRCEVLTTHRQECESDERQIRKRHV